MASPQVKNGYIKISTELMEALIKIRIPGEERQLFDFIIRKTYGFKKKEDQISLSQFVKATGIKKPHVCRGLNNLLEKKLITKNGNTNPPKYRIQKDYTRWKPLPKKAILPKMVTSVTKNGNKSLPKMVPTIDNSTIDTYTKEKEECSDFSFSEKSNPSPSKEKSSKKKNIQYEQKHFQLAVKLKRVIRERVPFQKIGKNDAENWANVIRLMEEQDKIPVELIEKIIDFIRIDDFWGTNIRSGSKLRKQFGVLHAQMDRERKPKKRLNPVTGQWEDASKWSQP
jgi:phage replication O-like protein O